MSSRRRSIVIGVVSIILLGLAESTPIPAKNNTLTTLELSTIRTVLEGVPRTQMMQRGADDLKIFTSTTQVLPALQQAIQRIIARISGGEIGRGGGNSYNIIPIISEELLSEGNKKPPTPQVAYGGSVSGPLLTQQKVPNCSHGEFFYKGECRTLIED